MAAARSTTARKTAKKAVSKAAGAKAQKKSSSAVKKAAAKKAGPRTEGTQYTPHGFTVGSDSALVAAALENGGVSRSEVVALIDKAFKGKKTRNGTPKAANSMAGNVQKIMLSRGWTVESDWRLVPPAKGYTHVPGKRGVPVGYKRAAKKAVKPVVKKAVKKATAKKAVKRVARKKAA